MRLFIAIQLNEGMKNALTGVQSELRRRGMRGNFTSLENLHLTLAFIGEYPDPDAVLDAMETVPFEPFPLRPEGFGHFGDLWWAGLSGSEALTTCVRRLRPRAEWDDLHRAGCGPAVKRQRSKSSYRPSTDRSFFAPYFRPRQPIPVPQRGIALMTGSS